MSNLTSSDLEVFARLRIPPELLERAGVVRVTDREAREEFGIRGSGDMAGIAFQYFDPETIANGRRRTYVRIRRDHPEVEDGKEKKKYIAPYGDRKRLCFPPTPELFADVAVPIVLVEAEKSMLALTAWAAGVGRKILPLAMGGCWGWRGQFGIKQTATGERVPETGAIPDLNICRDGRLSYVLLDANCATNPKVQQARSALVRQLQKQGAKVQILDLPAGDGINGPDDYLAVMGEAAMTQLFEGAGEGAEILNRVSSFIRRFISLSDQQARIATVWVAHTHAVKAATTTPYLHLHSAVKQSGKTRLLEVFELLVAKPWLTGRVTAACLIRKVDHIQPTLLLDESDAAFEKEYAEALRGILNTGYYADGVASSCVGQGINITYKDFKTFCAKAIAGIGTLPDTISDRSIPVRLQRKKPGEAVARFRRRHAKGEAGDIKAELSGWIVSITDRLKEAEPILPDELSDRQQDGIEPLLAIADEAGGDWPQAVRQAAIDIFRSPAAEDQNVGVQLLTDIRSIFESTTTDATTADKITSADLINKLKEIETSPWADWGKGKGLTPNGLSRLLKPFGISPRGTIRVEDKTAKGYLVESFEDAFSRYLPPRPLEADSQPSHPSQPASLLNETHIFQPSQKANVTVRKSASDPHEHCIVTDVTVQKSLREGGDGKEEAKQPLEGEL